MQLIELLQFATKEQASDLHLIVGIPPVFRIQGKLIPSKTLQNINKRELENIISTALTDEQKKRFFEEHELDFALQLQNDYRCRINLFFERGNMSLAARIIPKEIPSLEELGLEDELISGLIAKDKGLILVTGPSGCGKSTTLAAIVHQINKTQSKNIITLEDPIEFLHDHEKSIIRQREFGKDFFSFPEGLKRTLRQDPNVIMVGEMRDLDTISSAITLAETGHLILATLHTFNAGQTVDRIVNTFPPHQQDQIRLQFSMTLVAVISQQLLEKSDGKSRIAAREIMFNNRAISNLIRENEIEQIPSVIQTSRNDGMISMDQSIKQLVQAGIVASYETETSKTLSKSEPKKKGR